MTKKNSKQKEEKPKQDDVLKNLPEETKKRLEEIKNKLDKFKSEVLKKFNQYIIGISLLPPAQPLPTTPGQPPPPPNPKQIDVLVLVDDSDSTKMPKWELKDKLISIITKVAEDIDKDLKPDTVILSELWQSCYDGKYDLIRLIAMGAPVYDKGMLAAIKIAEVHKNMVLKKFEKYIVAYVLAGSLVQGKATPESDIDVYIVIDDTDVKKMTRAELKDKLRAIIIGMGLDAGDITGIKNKINIQPYILTEFWDSIREANPIIFTFLRDGVPFYDRGIFMPWKQLLKMGKIRPSGEAIDLYMSTGDQMLKRARWKIKDIGMEDVFYAILTPSQAALMMYGVPPPTPKETPEIMKEIFVKKEKLLEEKYVKILETVIKTRKDLEHGTKKDITGKEVDQLLDNAEDYLKRIDRLFKQIEKTKEEESMLHIYESSTTILRDILKAEGIEQIEEDELLKAFKKNLVDKGKLPARLLRIFEDIMNAKKDYDLGKLTKAEIEKVRNDAAQFTRTMIEYLQRKRGRELEKAKIRVKYGNKYGEILLLGKRAFIVHDIDAEQKQVSSAEIKENGSLGTIKDSSLEELEQAIATTQMTERAFIKEPIFEDLKRIFGSNVEILVNVWY
ncbi:MAG: nucleotidyltransferase domain-containing protein [Candidatus Woesearchaeota archaeon]